MADVRGKPVEGYKLSDGQKNFQKQFKRLREIGEMLEAATLTKQMEMEDLRQMWLRLGQEIKALPIPQQATRELEGMDFETQSEQSEQPMQSPQDFRITY